MPFQKKSLQINLSFWLERTLPSKIHIQNGGQRADGISMFFGSFAVFCANVSIIDFPQQTSLFLNILHLDEDALNVYSFV
jgi:hypothetical protein